jgi:hypothetical protein
MTHQDAVDTLATERYLLEEMPELERHAFEEHFFACDECARDLRVAAQLQAGGESAAGAQAPAAPRLDAARDNVTPMPARMAWRPSWSTVVPWAAAAVLALAVVYQVGQPGFDTAALTPTTLRPVSRGTGTPVSLPATGLLALALDVNAGAPGDAVAYTIAREDGTEVVSGRGVVPAPGTPLLLVIPARELRPGGAFVLTLAGTGNPAGPAAEYRFTAVSR